MDLTSEANSEVELECNSMVVVDYVSMVDPFLIEALQNPRHRLTILRMELDIQKFLWNSDQQQFEFPHFPTSYLRLAAHRVAQHYGLQTLVRDNVVDGQGACIVVVIKKPEIKFPAVCLSDVPVNKEPQNDIKFVIKPRPKAPGDSNDVALKGSHVRTVEERKEEYDRARARIFSIPSNSESEDSSSMSTTSDGRNLNDISRNLGVDVDKVPCMRETANSSRVAIFRDREKDLTDPDYDRSYGRYAKSTPSGCTFNLPPVQGPFVQYDSVVPQVGQMHAPPPPQPSINYQSPLVSPYPTMGLNQALYMQWPTHSMMYAQSYGQLRHTIFQAPLYQQPLSFDYSQGHR